jgi:DNA repair protein RadC
VASPRLLDRDPRDLDDASLLAAALGVDAARASRLLRAARGLAPLSTLGVGGLRAAGLRTREAERLAAAIEVARRAGAARASPAVRLADPRAVWAWAAGWAHGRHHEEMWLVALDGRNGLRAARRVAVGGLHGLAIAARDVLRVALREGASAFVVVHNHPSGDPAPSAEDVRFTAALASAANAVGTPLVDHVVVTEAAFHSMLEHSPALFTGDSGARSRTRWIGTRRSSRGGSCPTSAPRPGVPQGC